MVNQTQHIIERFNFELESAPTKRAMEVNQEVISLLKHQLLPAIESYFDQINLDERSLRFDQIDIELNFDSFGHLERELKKVVVDQLEEELQPYLGTKADTEENAAPGRIRDEVQSTFEALLFFLEKGQLPWWTGPDLRQNWIKRLEKAITEKPTLLRSTLSPLLRRSETIRRRLMLQFSPKLLDEILAVLLGDEVFSRLRKMIKKGFFPKEESSGISKKGSVYHWVFQQLSKKEFSRNQWIIFLDDLEKASSPMLSSSKQEQWMEKTIPESIWQEFFLEKGVDKQLKALIALLIAWPKEQTSKKELSSDALDLQLIRAILEVLERKQKLLENLQRKAKTLAVKPNAKDLQSILEAILQLKQLADPKIVKEATRLEAVIKSLMQKVKNIHSKEKGPLKEGSVRKQATGEEIFVENAGLVILHPFLLHYFKALDLCNDQEFTTEQTQETAIHLLHYLATGASQPAEFELTFNKLLCNWPLEEPLNRAVKINKEMKAESEKLLQSVIKHWNKLGNTSPDGLRGNFLHRAGKLVRKDNGWKLIVEKKAQDLLLDFLPWGIGVVRLPWMEDPVFVEWH